MDLIFTNELHEDEGVMHDFTLDLAFGKDENDFELTVDSNNHCCTAGCFVYIENTEYGGIIDNIKVVTKDEKIVYSGRSWHGILGSKIVKPDTGSSHYVVSGEANSAIASVIGRIGLSELFSASEEDSGLTLNNYQFDRYIDAYGGITKMLESVSGKLKFVFSEGKVVISALPSIDYSENEQFDNDQVEMEIEKKMNFVNHLVCLGKGELTDRLILHLYADANRNISESQTFFGLDEIEETYDSNGSDTEEKLKESGTKKFKELLSDGKADIDFDAESTDYDIGDIVGSKEIITGIEVKEKITKKIVTISKGTTNIEYKVGD